MPDDTKNLNIRGRVVGRDHWTPEDHAEWARRSRANGEVHRARRQALVDFGWELHDRRCSHHHGGEWALDPLGGEHVTHEEAYRRQEERRPGSIPSWPTFDNDWKPPSSNEGLMTISELKIQPLQAPSGLIFYQEYGEMFKDNAKTEKP
jgi:hypothetical protein